MNRQTAHELLKKAFIAAGLNGKLATHSLRKSFAPRVYEHSGDIYLVQELLGHKSVATTQKYIGINYATAREAVETMALGHEPYRMSLSGGSEPWQRWFSKIYVILNMSVLHIAVVASINESRKNPKRKTYKTKGIRYKIDQMERIIGTTFGILLWVLILCLDVWSIVSGRFYNSWSVYYSLRQFITIPIAVVWAFCVVLIWIEKADREERDDES